MWYCGRVPEGTRKWNSANNVKHYVRFILQNLAREENKEKLHCPCEMTCVHVVMWNYAWCGGSVVMPPTWKNIQPATRMNFSDVWNEGILLGVRTVYLLNVPITSQCLTTTRCRHPNEDHHLTTRTLYCIHCQQCYPICHKISYWYICLLGPSKTTQAWYWVTAQNFLATMRQSAITYTCKIKRLNKIHNSLGNISSKLHNKNFSTTSWYYSQHLSWRQ